jgi:hypothetical protein
MTQKAQKTKSRLNGEGSVYFHDSKRLWVASVTYAGKVQRFYAKQQNDAIQKRKDWLELRQQGVRPTSDAWLLSD